MQGADYFETVCQSQLPMLKMEKSHTTDHLYKQIAMKLVSIMPYRTYLSTVPLQNLEARTRFRLYFISLSNNHRSRLTRFLHAVDAFEEQQQVKGLVRTKCAFSSHSIRAQGTTLDDLARHSGIDGAESGSGPQIYIVIHTHHGVIPRGYHLPEVTV